MNVVLSGFFTNISATWFIAIFIIPQASVVYVKNRLLHLLFNIVGVVVSFMLAVLVQ
jgi:hypothetical protein